MGPGRRPSSTTGDAGEVERNGRIRVLSGGLEDLRRVEVGTASRGDREDRPAAHGCRRGRGTGMSMPSSSVPRRAFAWPVIGFLVVIGLVIAASLAAYAFRGPGSGFVFFPFFGFGWVFFLLFFLFFWGMRWWGRWGRGL